MAQLITDFVCVAQSGPTVDGRHIDPQWLIDMAETYNPEVYTAKLWPEHERWMSYGKVFALKAETKGDTTELHARIAPNLLYLWDNAQGQKEFFSIEPELNFAKTGKCYLVGLGVTDSPASLGTSEMRFSRRVKQNPVYPGTEVDFAAFVGALPRPGRIDRFLGKRFGKTQYSEEKQIMDENFMDEVITRLDDISETLNAIGTDVTHIVSVVDTVQDVLPDEPMSANNDTEDFKQALKDLQDQFAALTERLDRVQNYSRNVPATTPQTGEAQNDIV